MECAEGSDQESAEGQKKGEAEGEAKMNAEDDQRAAEVDKVVDVEELAENFAVIDMNAEGDECARDGDKAADVVEEIFENLVVTDMNEEAAGSGFSLQETANEEPEADAVTIPLTDLGSSEDVLNATLVEKMATGPGSDSGVEVNGGASPAGFLRAFSGSYGTSSCGDTPATASCDSSLISCCSAYEDTEEVATTTATTMLLPSVEREGDGTSEGGSESSSVDTDIRNKGGGSRRISSQGVNLGSTNSRTAVKKKSVSDTPTKAKVTSRGSSSTPVTSSSATRPKTTVSRPSRTPPSPGVSTQPKALSTPVSTSSSHQEKSMVSSCGSIRSTRSSTKSTSSSMSSGSTLRPVLASANKTRTKDSSMSSTSSRDSTASPAAGRGRASTSRSSAGSLKTKPIGATDDGRWPSSANRVHHRPQTSNKMEKKQMMSSLLSMSLNGSLLESKATALEKYATLPRRRRHKSPETTPVVPSVPVLHRSHSVSRDPSLNRAASLRKQHHHQTFSNKSLPPYPRRKRTIIYHEMAIQTALTGDDMAKAMAGIAIVEPLKCVDTQEQGVQVDQTAEEVDHLELQLKLLNEDHEKLKEQTLKQSEEMNATEQQLEEEKAATAKVTEELERHSQCIQNILSTANGDHVDESGMDCLQALENYFRSSSHVVLKQQQEIGELQMLCRTLQRDLEKSLAAQKTLLQQQQDIEVESMELQDFLQAEKSTLAEALKDAEAEIKGQKELLSQKEHELEQQQEECKHLVRISEQRRQENLALQAKLNSLEQRSRELLLQQGAAVSGAAVALSGLSSRLDGLVEQLVISYNISEKDLEDVIFHNEAYSKSNSSVEASPEKMSSSRNSDSMLRDTQRTPSPKRGASFVSAVISAIRNAAAGGTVKASKMSKEDEEGCGKEISSGGEIAEVVEPVSNTEQPDEGESNDRHSTGSTSTRCLANSESLQNLSQAILNRQQFEMAQTESTCSEDIAGIECESADLEALPPLEDYSPAITLVDQIIDVDNLVTKLLKVLRIIQLENDTCIDELHDERMQLAEQVRREQENRREAQDELRNWERIGARLRGEAQDVRLQLHRRVQELEEKKEELRQHKEKIEQLTQELCNLSSMCKQMEEQLRSREDEAEHILQQWQESGQYPSPESLARVITVQNEVPVLKEKLSEKERQLSEMGQKYALSKQVLTQNWHQAATEVRRQYEAIDTALETLHDIQGVVLQCPPLAKLQQDLEETNFQCASSLPLIAADLNANAPQLMNITHNGSHNSSTSRIDAAHNSGNAINGTA